MKTAAEFVAALNAAFAGKAVFELREAPKYDRVYATSYGQKSVYLFIDKAGNIYKAASYKAPAKGVRATLEQMTPEFIARIAEAGYASTAWLYR